MNRKINFVSMLLMGMVVLAGFAACSKKESGSTATDSSAQMTAANNASKGEKAKASAKGLNWTTLSAEQTGFVKLGETKDIYSVAYGNGKCVAIGDTPRGPWKKGAALPEECAGVNCGIYADGKFVFVSSSGIAFTDSPSNKWTFLDAKVIGLSLTQVGLAGGGIAYADGYMFFLDGSGSLYYTSNLSENSDDWKKTKLEGIVFYSITAGNGTLCCLKGDVKATSSLVLSALTCKVGEAWMVVEIWDDHSASNFDVGVIHAGDKFIAFADKGRMAYSSSW